MQTSVHPEPRSPGGTELPLLGQAKPFLIQLWLARFPQVNLIFLNTGLCFSFITAGADREL